MKRGVGTGAAFGDDAGDAGCDLSAYLVPVDALQRGLDLLLREGGWVAKSERAALRARRGCPERVFECADRRSGTQRARGHVEGVAEDAARA